MNAKLPLLLLATILWMPRTMSAQDAARDTTFSERNIPLDEVVVTGTRNETDVRHLSQTVSVLGCAASVADRVSIEPSPNRTVSAILTLARIDGTDSRFVHHLPWHYGIWCVQWCGRRHFSARVVGRKRPVDGAD